MVQTKKNPEYSYNRTNLERESRRVSKTIFLESWNNFLFKSCINVLRRDTKSKGKMQEGASVSNTITRDWVDRIWLTIRKGWLQNKRLSFQRKHVNYAKKSEERITVFVCANRTGTEKKKMLLIRKSKAPRCFKSSQVLPVTYTPNKKPWITSEIFKWETETRSCKNKTEIYYWWSTIVQHIIKLKTYTIKLVFFHPIQRLFCNPWIKQFHFTWCYFICQHCLKSCFWKNPYQLLQTCRILWKCWIWKW